jgi:hypothetical protein
MLSVVGELDNNTQHIHGSSRLRFGIQQDDSLAKFTEGQTERRYGNIQDSVEELNNKNLIASLGSNSASSSKGSTAINPFKTNNNLAKKV